MPKSRIRKKDNSASAPEKKSENVKVSSGGSQWVAPLMLTLFLLGLIWIVLFYVTNASLPISAIGNWNIVVGFGFIAGGFVVSTQWK